VLKIKANVGVQAFLVAAPTQLNSPVKVTSAENPVSFRHHLNTKIYLHWLSSFAL